MGIPSENIFISEIGKVLEIDKRHAGFNGTVPAGNVLVDGSGIGDIGNVVLRDRKHLSEEGLVVVVVTLDLHDKYLVSGPDIVSRGFTYTKDNEDLMEEASAIAYEVMERMQERGVTDWGKMKANLRDSLNEFFWKTTKRRPMILPILMEV
jgi:ribonuclease J